MESQRIVSEPRTIEYSDIAVAKAFGPVRYRFFLTGLGFVLLLLLPILDQLLGLSAEFKSTEKRILAPFPTFQFPHIQTYIRQFDQYYKENFGWRNALFYQYNRLKYNLMEVSSLPEKVVVGKHGWFYPGNSFAHIADQHRGCWPIKETTLEIIAQRLTDHQRKLARQGTKLYILIAPDSYTIYPEYLPDYLQCSTGPSNFDRLKQYLVQQTTIPLVDVREALCTAKASKLVYSQTDSHWNQYGALIASLSLIGRVRQDFPRIPMARPADYTVRAIQGEGGDLVTMLALNREIRDSINYAIRPPKRLLASQQESIPNNEMHLPSQRFVSMNYQLPKLLLVGDSFSYSMNPFITGYFRESYLVRSNVLKPDLIRQERPDVVVFEIVERNLDLLTNL
jgi:hypothetical protein